MAEENEQQARDPGDEPIMAQVLFLDIVGYSKLSMERQRHALRQLQEIVRSTQEFSRAENLEQLLSLPTGDGMALVFFTSTPLAPVQCALELGTALRAQPEIALRMGVHSGPVYPHSDIRVNNNVVGGGINIAQRVMDCGDAGHILLSKAVADVLNQIGGWAESLYDLGEIKVKHKVRVHIFNLYTGEAGNKEPPWKYRQARILRRAVQGISVCALLAVLGFVGLRLWRTTPPPPPVQERALTYWLTIMRQRDGTTINATGRETFDTGDEFRIHITPSQAGALYLFNEGTSRDWHVLFPTPKNNQGNARLAALETITTGENVFTNKSGAEKGTEKIWLIWTTQPTPLLDGIVMHSIRTELTVNDPSQRDALWKFLREHETPRPEASPVAGAKNQITLKGSGETLVHLLELQHADWK